MLCDCELLLCYIKLPADEDDPVTQESQDLVSFLSQGLYTLVMITIIIHNILHQFQPGQNTVERFHTTIENLEN